MPAATHPHRSRARLLVAVFAALGLVGGGLVTAAGGKRSYAFAYDDVNDQSSVRILGNSNPPSRLTLGIGW
jgi:hypothetical protein